MGTNTLQTPSTLGVVVASGSAAAAVRLRVPMTGLPTGAGHDATVLRTTPGTPPPRVPPS